MQPSPVHLTSFRSRWQPTPAGSQAAAHRAALADWLEAGAVQWPADFEATLEAWQRSHNPVYGEWRAAWSGRFMPVEAFKHREVLVDGIHTEVVFRSSGTTPGAPTAVHALDDVAWYDAMALAGFEWFYGDIRDWEVFALLPGYLERGQSSLVHMVASFRRASGAADVEAGFYLRDLAGLRSAVEAGLASGKRVLVVGVTYALLDWADQLGPPPLRGYLTRLALMETGGMKGTREEWTRAALHEHLRRMTGVPNVHSEYGMTELLSQAYAMENGRFRCPPWLRVVIGDPGDPAAWLGTGRRGRIHLVDLANVHSCALLATGDAGRAHPDGSFEVLGRFDAAEIRGCNLMVAP